jgi:hypothetical protein
LISLHTKRAFYISPTTAWGKGLRVTTGAVLLIYRSTPSFYTAETVTADIVSPTGNQSLHTSSDLLCADDYNSMLSTSNASDVSASRS